MCKPNKFKDREIVIDLNKNAYFAMWKFFAHFVRLDIYMKVKLRKIFFPYYIMHVRTVILSVH